MNSEGAVVVEAGSESAGVRLVFERGTTQPGVKVPKCLLSVKVKKGPRSKTTGRWA